MDERIENIKKELFQEEKFRLFYELAVQMLSLYDEENSDKINGFLEDVKSVIDDMDDMDSF